MLIETRPAPQMKPATEDELQRFLIEQRLDFLFTRILGYGDWDKCHDEYLAWDRAHKSDPFKLVLMPRGHLKSTMITVAKTIQEILINPNICILIASAVWGNARSFLAEIKQHLQKNRKLIALYGRFDTATWNSDEIIIPQRTRPNKTPTIDTAGIEKTLTSQHYDLIIPDDLVTRENITNSEQLQKVENFRKDLRKLLNPDGRMQVVGTRWHDADVYGHIEKNLTKEIMGEDRYAVHKRKATENGEPIFPKKFSVSKLKSIKADVGSFEYAANYDNDPVDPETQAFKPPFRTWKELGDGAVHYGAFDPATSEKKNACDAVVMDACMTRANQLCAVEYKAFQKKEPREMIDRIFDYVTRFKIRKFIVETNGGQEAWVKLLQDEQRARNVFFEVVPLHQHKDKTSRILALQPRHESGNLLLKEGMIELEEQMTRFPVSAKLDVVDALAMVHQTAEPQHFLRPKVWVPPEHRRSAA